MRVAPLLALAACYSPSAPSGVPCAPEVRGARCPDGQVCIEEICRAPGDVVDAGADDAPRIDGPPGDSDGDGVADGDDGCPDTPDPQQFDEDGDQLGDACDPCPIFADATPTDIDGDGVQDECDPNPATPGDKLVVFEGFNAGMPTGWLSEGSLLPVAGAINATVGDLDVATLGPPLAGDRRSTVAVGFTVTAFVDSTSEVGASHASSNEASLCALFVDGDKGYGVIDVDTDTIENADLYNWALDTPYTITQTRRSATSNCTIVDAAGAKRSLSGPNHIGVDRVAVEAYTRGVSGRFLWLMHVDSP